MPRFRYKAIATTGEALEGELDAPSRQSAIDRLQSAGHLPISADEVSSAGRRSGRRLFSIPLQKDRLSANEISIFTNELATLLNAGLPLDSALGTIEELSEPGRVKTMVKEIRTSVQGGVTLSGAIEEHETVFGRLYLNMVRAGEAGGALDLVFERLSEYLQRTAELRSEVISALIYPGILFTIAMLSVFALLTFVVPQFIPLFEDMGQTLPLMTRIVFGSAELFKHYWWLIPCILAAVIWFAQKQLAIPAKRQRFDAWCLRVALLGELITKLEVARFARTLGTLLTNGVPLLTAVSLVREVLGNRVIAGTMDSVTSSLEAGHGLAQPLQVSGVFPKLAVQLIQVGEESGQLENMLLQIADIYDNESRITVKRLLTLFEPILILGLGLMIALIIISILLAILGMNELVL
jgi:general secretion pathway protein F